MKLSNWIGLAALLAAGAAAPAAPAAEALIHIDAREYTHEIKLWHFYYGYWFSQGEAVEPVALEEFKAVFGQTAMCEGNKTGDVVIWVKPRMFYNPHMTMFYGSITAEVFSGSGRLLGRYKGDARYPGFLDVYPQSKVRNAYTAAMREAVRQMQADAELRAALAKAEAESGNKLPCGIVSALPPVK